MAAPTSKNPQQYVEQNGFTWTFVNAPEAFEFYEVRAIPVTVFIDRAGNVTEKVVGGMGKAEFESKLANIL